MSTQLYKVTKPNILVIDPKTGDNVAVPVGTLVQLTDKRAASLKNKVELAPTVAQMKAEGQALKEAASAMTAKAGKMLAGVTGKKDKKDKKDKAGDKK